MSVEFVKLPNGQPDETLVAIIKNATTLQTVIETLQTGTSSPGFSITRVALSSAAKRKQESATIGIINTSAATYQSVLIVPETGTLESFKFVPGTTLAANDTNYITFEIVNSGQAGVGTTAMLAVSDANTTKATGGSALAAGVPRALTIHGTAANLVVTKGDVIVVKATVTGTLANSVSGSTFALDFTGTT